MPLPTLIILGDRTANEVYEAALQACATQFANIEKLYFEPTKFVEQDAPRITQQASQIFFLAGMANEVMKQQVVEHCEAWGWLPFTIIHPSAVIAPSATIAPGTFIAPLAVVSSYAEVGAHAMVHIHASVGHDARIGDYAAILPGARISGHAVVGKRSLVGSNAFIAAGKSIGDDCRVDAQSYVNHDLAAGSIVSPRFPQPLKRVELRGGER